MKTTAKQFAEFKEECRRLQKLWGMSDWDVRIRHEYPRDKEALASCSVWSKKRTATIRMSLKTEKFAPTIKELARHEMIHVLIGRVCDMATDRWGDGNAMEEAEEALVQKLIRLLPR